MANETTEQQQMPELKDIDINDVGLAEGEQENLDLTADAFEQMPPVPDGRYKVKVCYPKQSRHQQGEDRQGKVYFRANLELRILDNEKYANAVIFANVSTLVGAKGNSTMATLLTKMGAKNTPATTTHKGLLQYFDKVMKQEPKIFVDTEWRAWDGEKGEWIKQGMKNFPQKEGGGYNHAVKDSKGKTVFAKAKVLKWLSAAEAKATPAPTQQQAAKPAQAAVAPKKAEPEGFEEMLMEE